MTSTKTDRPAGGLSERTEAGGPAEDQSLIGRAEHAVEEVIEETERCIGHYPVSAVAATFAGGVLGGWLVGRLAARGPKTRRPARGTEGPPEPGAGKGNREAVLNWEDEGGRGAPERRQTQ